MKKLVKIHIALTVVLITIIVVTFKFPSDLCYKPWFVYLFWMSMFCELIVFPSFYIYKEFEKKMHGIITLVVFSVLMFIFVFFPLVICSSLFRAFYIFKVIDTKVVENNEVYYYSHEDYFNESCSHRITYKSLNPLFYIKLDEERDCTY